MTRNHIVAFAGGVGGAKLAYGLYHTIEPSRLTIIVNTGDDFEHLGLHISPDVDTVMYTLADIANPQTGWGVQDESWHMMDALQRYGGPTWFNLGDRDMATHLLRTMWLREGRRLHQITAELSGNLGITCTLLPMSNQPVRTMVATDKGDLPFQRYFVEERTAPVVQGVRFIGAEVATAAPGVVDAIAQADRIIFCPSNPLLSIDPILAIAEIREAIMANPAPKIGVSPIVGGAALKGPAAKMMRELHMDVSPVGVARHLQKVLTHWVIDTVDAAHASAVQALGLQPFITHTIMQTPLDKVALAKKIVAL